MSSDPDAAPERRAPAVPFVLASLGAALFGTGLGQPAFVGGRIGPGLFMQGLAAVVIGLAVLEGIALLLRQPSDRPRPRRSSPLAAGSLVLGGVAAFAVAVPWLGLAGAAAPAATLAALGAGERRLTGLAITVAAAVLLAAAIGAALLPPTTRLWPRV
jgi:hypothetical protein